MKKLLTLLSLTLSMTAFAAPQGNSEQSATMNINATVIKPLRIQVTQNMDFGTVIQGSSAEATGTYKITGEPGQGITINTTLPEGLTNNINKAILPIAFNSITKNIEGLNQNGEFYFNITGTIEPTEGTQIGNYTGEIIARVQYQ
ncbi:hypothetical protein [Cetobacterium sp.]|uniref:hypothetical protein n=1 Tax=Cetobacterium sp. TaxID=2071632 RepID=UPI003F389870